MQQMEANQLIKWIKMFSRNDKDWFGLIQAPFAQWNLTLCDAALFMINIIYIISCIWNDAQDEWNSSVWWCNMFKVKLEYVTQ